MTFLRACVAATVLAVGLAPRAEAELPRSVMEATAALARHVLTDETGRAAGSALAVKIAPGWAVTTIEFLDSRSEEGLRPSCYRSSLTPGLLYLRVKPGQGGAEPLSLVAGAGRLGSRADRCNWMAVAGPLSPGLVTLQVRELQFRDFASTGTQFVRIEDLNARAGLGLGMREDGQCCGVAATFLRDGAWYGVLHSKRALDRALRGLESLTPKQIEVTAVEAGLLGALIDVLLSGNMRRGYGALLNAYAELPKRHAWKLDLLALMLELPSQDRPGTEIAQLDLIEGGRSFVQESGSLRVIEGQLLVRAGRVSEGLNMIRPCLADPASAWKARATLIELSTEIPAKRSELMKGVLPLPSSECPIGAAGKLGTHLLMLGALPAARRLLGRAVQAPLVEPAELRAYASLLRREGDQEGALRALRAALVSPLANVHWYGELGDLLGETGDLEGALRAYDFLVGAVDASALLLAKRAWLRSRSGDAVGAMTDAERVVALAPRDTDAWALIGRAAVNCGDEGVYAAVLRQLDEVAPDFTKRLRHLWSKNKR